ncbi:hypothetical protein A2160_04265 [Candidatus Beckwithbacteria bacterium RBG_13_42_9]|uniref:Transcriptional regulator n=1 Tax=Candidatus Beckwithbacteria bacterium RBG_13_42_9 TaxID=1797457 RepID=A0A1F5E6J5_9BACT|nr:MAG: hypothetical protein A2160_04265 [Candidatus Beckwithbacteria bacterium RBG_13_42_9]
MVEKSKVKSQKSKVRDRLRRISGQIQGIEKMVADNKDCLQVVQQVVAARNALGKVATIILTQESCKLSKQKSTKKFEKIINNLICLRENS